MIRLYIENTEIELSDSVEFAITRQWEELTNPTTIINDWSKTVEIPFTHKNNQTFGSIYNVDMKTIEGSPLIGLYFNPLKKLDFRLEYNDAVVMTGYAKMNTVTKKDDAGTYNITLNGTLGKVLQELQKITFDSTKDDSEHYYIAPTESFGTSTINKELVYYCWNGGYNPSHYPALTYIGFAPNNSYNDNFTYDSYQSSATEIKKFSEVLEGSSAFSSLNIDADTVIGDGLLPKDIGEYRSYLQLPYIYTPKLWELFKSKAESVTDYTFDMDSEWFNTGNTLWQNSIMMLKQLDVDSGNVASNTYAYNFSNEVTWYSVGSTTDVTTVKETASLPDSTVSYETADRMDYTTGYLELKNTDITVNKDDTLSFYVLGQQGSTITQWYWNIDNAITIKVQWINESSTVVSDSMIVVYRSDTTNTEVLNAVRNATLAIAIPQNYSTSVISGRPQGFKFTNIGIAPNANIPSSNNKVKLKVSAAWVTAANPAGFGTAATNIYFISDALSTSFEITENFKRSSAKFTLNDLWNNDYLPYDMIINYCKIHHILVQVDDMDKKIKFTPAWKYFRNYSVEDWTSKLDLSKDYIITPCSFENKYILFNYEDNETKLGEDYREKYGYDFGEMNLITDYNFNTDTKELFSSPIPTSIVYSDNNKSWNDLVNGKIRYVVPMDILPYVCDEDSKYVSNFGALYIYKGRVNFDDNSAFNFRIPAYISDDTNYMIGNSTYCYAQSMNGTEDTENGISTSKYVQLDIIDNDIMCLYNKPKKNYTWETGSYDNGLGIYQKYWQNYLAERYYSGNKKVTCYLKMKPIDYMNFQFNKFIKIENQLYFVNKIYDYSITDTISTKVDLITVNDISKYYTIN